jgi:hypothetical protein
MYTDLILWSSSHHIIHTRPNSQRKKHHTNSPNPLPTKQFIMHTTLVPNTPSQQTREDLSVLVKGDYRADRCRGSIITCDETPEGNWRHVAIYRRGERDEWSVYNLTSLKIAHNPLTHEIYGSVANTEAFDCSLPPHNGQYRRRRNQIGNLDQ